MGQGYPSLLGGHPSDVWKGHPWMCGGCPFHHGNIPIEMEDLPMMNEDIPVRYGTGISLVYYKDIPQPLISVGTSPLDHGGHPN